jgi:glycosyltransferase involved in cell wall biosynthesis
VILAVSEPTIAILIPVFNGQQFIVKAIESALVQASANEIIVVDNCSTDETWSLVNQFQDERLSVFRNERNLGLFGNFNACLEKTNADIVVFLCADDKLSPDAVSYARQYFSQFPEVAVLNTRGVARDADGHEVKQLGNIAPVGVYRSAEIPFRLFRYLLSTGRNVFNFPAGVYLQKRLFPRLRFDLRYEKCGDIDFYFRALRSGPFGQASHLGCEIGFHPQQLSQVHRDQAKYMREYSWMMQPEVLAGVGEAQAAALRAAIAGLSYWKAGRFLLLGNVHSALAFCQFAWSLGMGLLPLMTTAHLFWDRIRTAWTGVAPGIDIKP